MDEKPIGQIEADHVVIGFSGDSGDGMQLTGSLFADTSALLGNGILTFPDYPAEIRAPQGSIAGVSGFQLHFGAGSIDTPGDRFDTLVAMNPAALRVNAGRLKNDATVICDIDGFTEKNLRKARFTTDDPFKELGIQDRNLVLAPIGSLTKEALVLCGLDTKNVLRCKNMYALGICCFLYDRPLESIERLIRARFPKKPAVAAANVSALKAGYHYAHNTHCFPSTYRVPSGYPEKGRYRNISGNQATAWGLIAAAEKSGRPLFCGSYPITPATGILEELARRKDLGVKTLQAEDEIAGICTAIGASFAGNFAVTATSGPGLSLQSEALGLAVMTELPLVVVDVQRGGPSTGLPTKTEQSDLHQALWGRNGECPLVVMAGASPSDCFDAAFFAGKIAMEHMTPVLLLTDGFIANGSQPWRIPSMKDLPEITPPIISEVPEGGFLPYRRNKEKLARSWALPGSPGLEHRVGGLEKDFLKGTVSHDPDNHRRMVDVREAKVQRVARFLPLLKTTGDSSGELLVIGWGGTYGHLLTAVRELRAEGLSVSFCHFRHINPLPENTRELLSRFSKQIVCELNLGQFAGFLRMNFPELEYYQYNKVEGRPFTVSELKQAFIDALSVQP